MYDLVVIGNGIVGSLLVYEASKKYDNILWIGDHHPAASTYSGAIINPVAGKNLTVNENSLERYNFAIDYYQELEKVLSLNFLKKFDLLFLDKTLDRQNEFVSEFTCHQDNKLSTSLPIVKVKDVYKVDQATLLPSLTKINGEKVALEVNTIHYYNIDISNNLIKVAGVPTQKLIFCEGVKGFENPFFESIPFTINYGQVIHFVCEELPSEFMLDFDGLRIVPLGNHLFWCGGLNYWSVADESEKNKYTEKLTAFLKDRFGINDFEILLHELVQRPTVAGQQPFMVTHPENENVMQLNGLGTRGYSATPLLIKNIIENI